MGLTYDNKGRGVIGVVSFHNNYDKQVENVFFT